MKIARSMSGFVLVGVLSMLAACSSSHNKTAANDAALSSMNQSDSAQTYGVAQSGAVQTDSNGRIINPLTAPSNQTYYFGFNNSVITQEGMKAILVQADYLANHPNVKIRLEGNTDARGSREYNIGLGWRRDQSVARILEQQGVKANQIDMVSFGKEQPAIVGDNEQAWSLNRRVHLVYENIS